MSESDANPSMTDASESSIGKAEADAGNPELSPLEGGRWRPVSPDELLRKPSPEQQDPQDAETHLKVRLERRQELEHKLKANPTDLDGFLELAAIYRAEHRPLEAKRLLDQAVSIFPDDENLRFQLEEAVLARSLQQFREVSDLAARLNTPEADRELERSRADWAMRRIEVCKARLERDASQHALRMAMADAKFDAEMFDEAFADTEKLLELDEFSPQAHFLRARCLLALGKDLPAMKELRAVALRRAVVAPENLRHASLKLLCELAEKLALDATLQQYRAHLKRIEDSASSNASQVES